jgi:hypothetical protein
VGKKLKPLPREYTLQISSVLYASDGSLSLKGMGGVLKVIIETWRDWKEKREQQRQKSMQEQEKTTQERERTAQEREKTLFLKTKRMREEQALMARQLATVKDYVKLRDLLGGLSRSQKAEIFRQVASGLEMLQRTSIGLAEDVQEEQEAELEKNVEQKPRYRVARAGGRKEDEGEI